MTRYDSSMQYNGDLKLRIMILSIIAIAVAAIGFGVYGTAKFLISYFGPPLTITEQIVTETPLQSLPFFKAQVTGDQMLNSGMYEITSSTRDRIPTNKETITAHFGYLVVGDYLVMVKTPKPINPRLVEYSGVLTAVGVDEVAQQVYHEHRKQFALFKDAFVPLLLDTNYDVMPWFTGFAFEIVLLFAGLAGLVKVRRGDFDQRL